MSAYDVRTMGQIRRVAALTSALTGLTGGVLIAIAVAAMPHPWTTGYVSEAGAPGAAHAGTYRIGLLLLAIALLLLGNVVITTPAMGMGITGILLVAAGALTAVSSRVSCTANCPLPPYEHSTVQDLVHAGTSIAAVGLTSLAMLAVAASATDRRQVHVARTAAAICLPVLVALAIALLAIGRSTLTAVLERLGLAGVLLWVVACALLAWRPARAVTRPAPP